MKIIKLLKTQMKVAPLIGREDYEGAVRVLEGELSNTPDDLPFLELIAQCRWWAGSEEKAIEIARKALALDPKNFEMSRMLSQIFAEHEDHEETIKYVKLGLNSFPTEHIPAPPPWVFYVLKLAGKFSVRLKRVEETTKEDLSDPDKGRKEWYSWANSYLEWYEKTMEK